LKTKFGIKSLDVVIGNAGIATFYGYVLFPYEKHALYLWREMRSKVLGRCRTCLVVLSALTTFLDSLKFPHPAFPYSPKFFCKDGCSFTEVLLFKLLSKGLASI